MLALAPVLTTAALVEIRPPGRLGFFCGCVIAYLNFHWLKSGVSGLADRVTNTGKPSPAPGSSPASCCAMCCWEPLRMLY